MLRDYAFLLLRRPGDVRRVVMLLLGLTVSAVLETVGVGLVLPFVALLQQRELTSASPTIRRVAGHLHASSMHQLIGWCGGLLVFVFVVKSVFVLFIYRLQMRFTFNRMTLVMK